jgi:hypothetical protein
METKVTFAPADDSAFTVIRYAAMGTALVPTVTNWFDDPASSVKPVVPN